MSADIAHAEWSVDEPQASASLPYEVDEDGCLFNPETGEVYPVEMLEKLNYRDDLKSLDNPWAIESREDAERALEKRSLLESDRAAIVMRLETIKRNLEAQLKAIDRREAWWDYRFSSNLIAFARRQLRKGSKTVQFDYGAVAFRDKPAGLEIIDEAAALDWASKWAPQIIKQEVWVNKTDIDKARKALAADGVEGIPAGVREVPKVENVPSIKTGI